MTFGEYIKSLRLEKGFTQKQLCALTNDRVSNAEISRLESGERKKPAANVLKLIAPHLGISYQDLLIKAGYIEEVEEREGFSTAKYYDSEGNIIDIVRTATEIYQKDPDLLRIVNRVAGDLSVSDINTIKNILTTFVDDKMSSDDKNSLRTLIHKFTVD